MFRMREFRMLAYRIAETIETNDAKLDEEGQTLEQDPQPVVKSALEQLVKFGKRAEKDKGMRAKRCFSMNYEEAGKDKTKWVVSTPAHTEFMEAAGVLRRCALLSKIGIRVEEDRATMSKVAKEVTAMLKDGQGDAGKGSSSSGRRVRQKKK